MPKKLSRTERYGGQAGLPQTLQEVVTFFADEQTAFDFAVSLRWPDGVFCPFCNSAEHSFISTRRLWKCKGCKKQFSVRVGTIFEDSPLPLSKWMVVIWMLVNCKNGVSSYEVHRAIEVTQKTAWFMLHRVRAAIKAKSFDQKLGGLLEADETFIGGALKNMHKSKRRKLEEQAHEDRVERAEGHKQLGKKRRVRTGAGPLLGKSIVQAIVERDGKVRTQILETLATLERLDFIIDNVDEGARVMTDTGNAYLGSKFIHEFVNHAEQYVDGQIHTNSVENFWSLLQRTLAGTYVAVAAYHLAAYADEQSFRFNNRETNDGNRFLRAMSQFPSTRLTHKDLIRSNGDGGNSAN